MFCGIISDIGIVERVKLLDCGKQLRIITNYDVGTIDIGASIAHSGVCLTVTNKSKNDKISWYEVEAWSEALQLTTLDKWQKGDLINLERSLRIGDEVGGHLVFGHVDGTARIVKIKPKGEALSIEFEAPKNLLQFISKKGSITLNGTSLTVNSVRENIFECLIVSHTLNVTTWGAVCKGDLVNIEVDQMARYVARITQFSKN